MIRSRRLVLRALEAGDLGRLWEWYQDPEITRGAEANPRKVLSLEALQHRHARRAEDPDWEECAIATHDGRMVGYLVWERRDLAAGVYGLGLLIGDKDLWGQGYGSEATWAVMGYLFDQLNAHKVRVGVFEFNRAALRMYEKCGFVREGLIRATNYMEGRYVDTVFLGILRPEYEALVRAGGGPQ